MLRPLTTHTMPTTYRIIELPEARIAAIFRAVTQTGRMLAGDDGDAENGPDFWYDGHTLGELSVDHHEPGMVWNRRRQRCYCTPAARSQAGCYVHNIKQGSF